MSQLFKGYVIIISSVFGLLWTFFYFFGGKDLADGVAFAILAGIGLVSGFFGGFFAPQRIKKASISSSATIIVISIIPLLLFGGVVNSELINPSSFGTLLVAIIIFVLILVVLIAGALIATFILLGGMIGKTLSPFK